MVTPSGRLPSVRNSPRGSSIEGKSRDPNVCFMRELRVAWREKRPALLVQERPCKPSRSTLLPQWHVCATQMLAPRRKPMEIRSCWSSSFKPRFLQGRAFSHWDPNLPWCPLKTFKRLSSILEINSWAVLTKTGCVQFLWVPLRGHSCSFVNLNHFSSAFVNETSSNVSEKIVVRKSLAPQAETKTAGSANNDADDTSRPPISAGRASWVLEYVEVHVTHFGKPVAYGFVILSQESWVNKTCTGSQEVQQLWQTEAIFQHRKTIVRI